MSITYHQVQWAHWRCAGDFLKLELKKEENCVKNTCMLPISWINDIHMYIYVFVYASPIYVDIS